MAGHVAPWPQTLLAALLGFLAPRGAVAPRGWNKDPRGSSIESKARAWRIVDAEVPPSGYWIIYRVDFYGNYVVDVGHSWTTCQKPLNVSMAIVMSSGTLAANSPDASLYSPEGAFKDEDIAFGQGWHSQFHNLPHQAWIGAEFETPVEVKCVRLYQSREKTCYSRRVTLQRREDNIPWKRGQWEDVVAWGRGTFEPLSGGEWLTLPAGLWQQHHSSPKLEPEDFAAVIPTNEKDVSSAAVTAMGVGLFMLAAGLAVAVYMWRRSTGKRRELLKRTLASLWEAGFSSEDVGLAANPEHAPVTSPALPHPAPPFFMSALRKEMELTDEFPDPPSPRANFPASAMPSLPPPPPGFTSPPPGFTSPPIRIQPMSIDSRGPPTPPLAHTGPYGSLSSWPYNAAGPGLQVGGVAVGAINNAGVPPPPPMPFPVPPASPTPSVNPLHDRLQAIIAAGPVGAFKNTNSSWGSQSLGGFTDVVETDPPDPAFPGTGLAGQSFPSNPVSAHAGAPGAGRGSAPLNAHVGPPAAGRGSTPAAGRGTRRPPAAPPFPPPQAPHFPPPQNPNCDGRTVPPMPPSPAAANASTNDKSGVTAHEAPGPLLLPAKMPRPPPPPSTPGSSKPVLVGRPT